MKPSSVIAAISEPPTGATAGESSAPTESAESAPTEATPTPPAAAPATATPHRERNHDHPAAPPAARLQDGDQDDEGDQEHEPPAAALLTAATLLAPHAAQAQPATGNVVPGIEVLLQDSLHLLKGKRVGLLTNHSARDRRPSFLPDLP